MMICSRDHPFCQTYVEFYSGFVSRISLYSRMSRMLSYKLASIGKIEIADLVLVLCNPSSYNSAVVLHSLYLEVFSSQLFRATDNSMLYSNRRYNTTQSCNPLKCVSPRKGTNKWCSVRGNFIRIMRFSGVIF